MLLNMKTCQKFKGISPSRLNLCLLIDNNKLNRQLFKFYNNSFCFISGINVPRSRFLPVKKTSDLLVVMSNLFTLVDGRLIQNTERSITSLPLVKLGDQHFQKVMLEGMFKVLCIYYFYCI